MGKRPQRVTTLTYSPDRLGRALSHLVNFLSEIHVKKVDLFIHQQVIDTTTPAGKALFGVMGVFAEYDASLEEGPEPTRDDGAMIERFSASVEEKNRHVRPSKMPKRCRRSRVRLHSRLLKGSQSPLWERV
jgi:hypothetical protein